MRIRRRPSLLVVAIVLAALVATGRSPAATLPGMSAAAAVSWPPSASLVISEVQTGGASASDEFVEIENVGPVTADLNGLELVGASASGATVARRTAWTVPTPIGPGRHALVANAAGVWASIADATYASGLAATGGAVALRWTGGAVVDAIGWGDATNGFVEGGPAPAPPAGSSIERLPGGDAGDATDTNDNAADWVVRAVPGPQRLADPPVPVPTPTASPTPATSPTPTPGPSDPPGSPTPTPSPDPTPDPTPTSTPAPEPTPSPTPSPTTSPSPTPPPTPVPTPTPTPTPMPIAEARRLADGDPVTIGGVLTTSLAALDGDRTGFVQDASAGIALYLDAAAPAALPAGTIVRASGTLDHRYGLAVVRVRLSDVQPLGDGTLPEPLTTATGSAGPDLEGRRIAVTATITDIAGALSDGLGLDVDDGSGALRVVVDTSILGGYVPARGDTVTASGPLGRRDGTTGTGFRLHATPAGSFRLVAPAPTPTPVPTPTPSPAPTAVPSASPSPTPSATATPSPAPSATPSPGPTTAPSPSPSASPTDRPVVSVAAALASPVGSRVRLRVRITAPPGRLWTERIAAAQDDSGALFCRIRTDDTTPGLGAHVDIAGTLVRSGTRVVLRADERWVASPADAGPVQDPVPAALAGPISRATDALLVTVTGTLARGASVGSDGHLALTLLAADGTRYGVSARPGSGIDAALVVAGTAVRVTGIAVAGGSPAAGRIWLRAPDDIVRASAPGGANSSATAGGAGTGGGSAADPVAIATLAEGAAVSVAGVVTVGPGLLTPRGRAIRIEDSSAAVDVLMPATWKGPGPTAGTRVVVTGSVVRLAAGLRIRAAELRAEGSATVPIRTLTSAPGLLDIGRIARVTGTVRAIRRSGAAWRAELGLAGGIAVIAASAASAISSAALVVGARVRATGLVTAPSATSADRAIRIVPRSAADVSALVAAAAQASTGGAVSTTGGATGGAAGPRAAATAAGRADDPLSPGATSTPARTAAQLVAAAAGEPVLVSGVARGLAGGALLLDDGTGIVRLALRGAAAALRDLVSAGDAIRASGTTERDGSGAVAVVVDDPSAFLRAGAPTGPAGSEGGPGAGAADGQGIVAADGASAGATAASAADSVSTPAAGDPLGTGATGDGPGGPSWPLDPLAVLVAVLGTAGGAALAVAALRRRRRALDPVVARRLAELGAASASADGAPGRLHLDSALGASLSSRPTSAGGARSR